MPFFSGATPTTTWLGVSAGAVAATALVRHGSVHCACSSGRGLRPVLARAAELTVIEAALAPTASNKPGYTA
ncbi:hypothetical protein [Streptomyces sp. NK08204]|uniref:hypothetical protein n=1 Tax=Streptomyces sp. NK08204 TaxID=2873260 RepID=UPI001CEDAD25|nr:hypothetical protein [Streptomyces sp. NK08204]